MSPTLKGSSELLHSKRCISKIHDGQMLVFYPGLPLLLCTHTHTCHTHTHTHTHTCTHAHTHMHTCTHTHTHMHTHTHTHTHTHIHTQAKPHRLMSDPGIEEPSLKETLAKYDRVRDVRTTTRKHKSIASYPGFQIL